MMKKRSYNLDNLLKAEMEILNDKKRIKHRPHFEILIKFITSKIKKLIQINTATVDK